MRKKERLKDDIPVQENTFYISEHILCKRTHVRESLKDLYKRTHEKERARLKEKIQFKRTYSIQENTFYIRIHKRQREKEPKR